MNDANADAKVGQWLHDVQLTHPELHAVVLAARAAVHAVAPSVSERIMYGGLMFSAPVPFCGLFVYSAHVSMEFGRGAELDDPHRSLEGKGQFRRHVKLRAPADIPSKHLEDHIAQALRLSATRPD